MNMCDKLIKSALNSADLNNFPQWLFKEVQVSAVEPKIIDERQFRIECFANFESVNIGR